MDDLSILRKRLDEIDGDLVRLLTERFRVTDAVGRYKSKHRLSAVDPQREAEQFDRLRALAASGGLEPEIAEKVLRCIIDEVVRRHRELAEGART